MYGGVRSELNATSSIEEQVAAAGGEQGAARAGGVAVFGLADGARGARDDLVHLVRFREPLEFRQHLKSRLDGLGRQPLPVETAGAKANHLLFAVDDLEGQIDPHADDDHVE